MNILLVDDEPDILELLAEEFEYNGHNVKTALSGNEAIILLKNESFDVVISDYKMPNGNGMSVLGFIQNLNPRPKFYFVSGHSDVSVDECMSQGAAQFITKPFDLANLIKVIGQ